MKDASSAVGRAQVKTNVPHLHVSDDLLEQAAQRAALPLYRRVHLSRVPDWPGVEGRRDSGRSRLGGRDEFTPRRGRRDGR